MKSGIYEIKNVVNGKRYIGSAVNFGKRWINHAFSLGRKDHHSRHLQNAWNKYGSSAFRFRLLRMVPPCYLVPFEQHYMDRLKPEYNMSPTAGSPLGVKHTEITRAKMSEAKRGNKSILGRRHSSETLAKMSAAKLGKKRAPFTDSHRANISAGQLSGKRSRKRKIGGYGII